MVKGRRGEREKGRKGEGEKGRRGEREKGRKGEGEKGRRGEREKRWIGKGVKWWSGEMINQWSDEVMKLWSEVMQWCSGAVVKRWSGEVAKWWSGEGLKWWRGEGVKGHPVLVLGKTSLCLTLPLLFKKYLIPCLLTTQFCSKNFPPFFAPGMWSRHQSMGSSITSTPVATPLFLQNLATSIQKNCKSPEQNSKG